MVPIYFGHTPATDGYEIDWGWAGDMVSRDYVVDSWSDTSTQLEKSNERTIPCEAKCVITHIARSFEFCKPCQPITEELGEN